MNKLAAELEAAGFLAANYERSIANIPATIAALLEIPFAGLPPLPGDLWQPLAGDVRQVVLLVVDALGWNLLQWLRDDLQEILSRAIVVSQITSVFPSTTVAALTSIWTGVAPAGHGLVGLTMWLPEFGTMGQFLNFSPAFGRYPDALVKAGLDPGTFLQAPGLAQQLAAGGAATYAYKSKWLVGSALSQMHDRGVAQSRGIVSLADMLAQVRQLLETPGEERRLITAYWPLVDSLSHSHGWQGASVAAEVRAVFSLLRAELLDRLTPAARRGTLLIITADHGQVMTPPEQQIPLEGVPELRRLLLMTPAGESRAPYLYAQQGRQEELVAAARHYLGDAALAYPAQELLAAGLFGPAPHAAATAHRIGDVVLIMREGYQLISALQPDFVREMVSLHGSLTPAETEVPLVALRLDGTGGH